MHRGFRTAGAACALLALALLPSDAGRAQDVVAHAEGRPTLDFDAFRESVPEMKALAEETLAQSVQLNELMERLAATEGNPAAAKEARAATRDLLVQYRDRKARLVRIVDRCMKTPPPDATDAEIVRKLHDSELVGVDWKNRKFIDCLRDISQALGVRFVLHTDVLKFNTVDAHFQRNTGEGLLRWVTTGFDCAYYVYNGEIIVIKAIKKNDKRMQEFLDKHPDWKYWRKKEAKVEEDDL